MTVLASERSNEKISFCCAQKEAVLWSFDIKLRQVRVRLLVREDHGMFN